MRVSLFALSHLPPLLHSLNYLLTNKNKQKYTEQDRKGKVYQGFCQMDVCYLMAFTNLMCSRHLVFVWCGHYQGGN
jgi:hypothetical protein